MVEKQRYRCFMKLRGYKKEGRVRCEVNGGDYWGRVGEKGKKGGDGT